MGKTGKRNKFYFQSISPENQSLIVKGERSLCRRQSWQAYQATQATTTSKSTNRQRGGLMKWNENAAPPLRSAGPRMHNLGLIMRSSAWTQTERQTTKWLACTLLKESQSLRSRKDWRLLPGWSRLEVTGKWRRPAILDWILALQKDPLVKPEWVSWWRVYGSSL